MAKDNKKPYEPISKEEKTVNMVLNMFKRAEQAKAPYVSTWKKCKEAYGNDVFVGKEGYCIIERENNDINADYYKVSTFVTIDFPFLNLSFTIPIQGETRKIERINT